MSPRTAPRAAPRPLTLLCLVGAGAAVLWFIAGPHDAEYFEWLPRGRAALLPGVLLLVCISWLAQRAWFPARVGALLLTLLLVGMAGARARLEWESARSTDHWPPRSADNVATASDSTAFARLADDERARWAARVAQHRLLTDSSSWPAGGTLAIPASWAFPPGVRVARLRDSVRMYVWARTPDGTAACVAEPALEEMRECGERPVAPAAQSFRAITRVIDPTPSPLAPLAADATGWTQYRRNGAHDARQASDARGSADTAASTPAPPRWSYRIDGPIRSAVSLAGDLALIGAHGSGAVVALDVATGRPRWTSRVPSWVHMDIVSDGRVAAVGFGDNHRSFTGRAPSGTSVYDLATGQLRWTRFDESSNMSGPLLRDSVLVYGTALGIIRTRALADGRLLAEDTLPGGVVMAPPAASGDTVVFTLEHDAACAVLAPTLRRLWCRTFPGHRMMGHAASAIADGQVVLSAVTTIGNLSWAEFRAAPFALARRLVTTALFPVVSTEHGGQRLIALDLATGEERWRTPNFPKVRWVDGHTAGTASLSDSIGLAVLPEADVTVGFDPRDGRVRWSAPAHLARGPALLYGTRAIVTAMDGTLEVRDAVRGGVWCAARRAVGFDRSGPAVGAGAAFLASREGTVEAVPLADVLRCALPRGPRPPRATSSPMSGH
ncbi:MAG: PQQ-binding-like beta-propeller repeat protein [Gemmatimonadetes bacterium]|nr:PQQ-binding-like beta-propeller repeat protein [Gemmatimonadota bacterium]